MGFSFGGACGSAIAAHFGPKVRAVTVIGPGGFSIKGRPRLDFIKYGDIKDDPKAYRHALGHNLLQLMLKHRSSLSEEVLDMQHDNVGRARFNSRNVSVVFFVRVAPFVIVQFQEFLQLIPCFVLLRSACVLLPRFAAPIVR